MSSGARSRSAEPAKSSERAAPARRPVRVQPRYSARPGQPRRASSPGSPPGETPVVYLADRGGRHGVGIQAPQKILGPDAEVLSSANRLAVPAQGREHPRAMEPGAMPTAARDVAGAAEQRISHATVFGSQECRGARRVQMGLAVSPGQPAEGMTRSSVRGEPPAIGASTWGIGPLLCMWRTERTAPAGRGGATAAPHRALASPLGRRFRRRSIPGGSSSRQRQPEPRGAGPLEEGLAGRGPGAERARAAALMAGREDSG